MKQVYISKLWLTQNICADMSIVQIVDTILAAPVVEFDADELTNAKRDLRDCRRELCVLCGAEEKQPLGACDGCRWREET